MIRNLGPNAHVGFPFFLAKHNLEASVRPRGGPGENKILALRKDTQKQRGDGTGNAN